MSDKIIKYEFAIIADKRIIHEKMYGFWNTEIAAAYTDDFKKTVTPLLSDPWSRCIDLRQWNPTNPAVIKTLTKLLKWTRKNNLAYSANIVVTKVPRLQMNTMFRFGKQPKYYEFFEDEKAAFRWLASKGF